MQIISSIGLQEVACEVYPKQLDKVNTSPVESRSPQDVMVFLDCRWHSSADHQQASVLGRGETVWVDMTLAPEADLTNKMVYYDTRRTGQQQLYLAGSKKKTVVEVI